MAIFPRNQPQGPQNTVLSIPELVELILLNTDTITVLISAQRVNKQWHDIIASSRRLQEHLFFRPAQKTSLQEPTNTNTATDQAHNSIPNPLIPKICMAIAHQPKAQVEIIFHHQKLPQVNKSARRRRDASWQRMLLRQPPSRRIGVLPRNYTEIVARIPVRAKGDNDELRGEDLAGLVLIKQASIMISEDLRIRVQHSKHVTDKREVSLPISVR